jgi:hypothetical protein
MKKKWQSNFIATSFVYVKSQIYITKNQGKQLSALEQYHFYCQNSDLNTEEIFEHFCHSQSHDLEARSKESKNEEIGLIIQFTSIFVKENMKINNFI